MNKTLLIILLFGLVACGYCEEMKIASNDSTRVIRNNALGLNLGGSAFGLYYRRAITKHFALELIAGKVLVWGSHSIHFPHEQHYPERSYNAVTLNGVLTREIYNSGLFVFLYGGARYIHRSSKAYNNVYGQAPGRYDEYYTETYGIGVEYRFNKIALALSAGGMGSIDDDEYSDYDIDFRISYLF